MLKHRGFPGRLPGTDLQFTIRRADPRGVTPLKARERFADRRPLDRAADAAFLGALWEHFGEAPFERGNLDAGRLGWLLLDPEGGPPITPVWSERGVEAWQRLAVTVLRGNLSKTWLRYRR